MLIWIKQPYLTLILQRNANYGKIKLSNLRRGVGVKKYNHFDYECDLSQMSEIGQNLKKIRLKQGLSQEAFSELLGVSRHTVINWEKGSSLPSIDKVGIIINKCSVSIEEIIGNENVADNCINNECIIETYDTSDSSAKKNKKKTAIKTILITVFSAISIIVLFAIILIVRDVIDFLTTDAFAISLKVSMSESVKFILIGFSLVFIFLLLILSIIKIVNFKRNKYEKK